MKCYKCGSFLYEGEYCNACGADVTVYRDIVTKSNQLYNSALEYAKDRNLSKAVEHLQTSLKLYKGNINSHNLLGLIYFEMGEYAKGFAHWVISKNFQPENNLASVFLNKLQEDKAYLDSINVAIKKYNKAVGYVQQGSYDLGKIQLKKLVNSDNIHMVKAYQLLALLRIREKKFAAAKKALMKAELIDAGNPTTIAMSTHVNSQLRDEEKELTSGEIKAKRQNENVDTDVHSPLSGDDVIIPKSSYKEYNPTTVAILQILVGFIVGAAIIFFIVVPAKTKAVRAENFKIEADLEAQIDDLTKENESLKATAGSAPVESEADDNKKEPEKSQTQLDDEYLLKTAYDAYQNGDYAAGAETIIKIKDPYNMDESSVAIYELIYGILMQGMPDQWYYEADQLFQQNDFAGALELYTRVYNLENTTGESLYFMALCNYNMDNYEEAGRLFQEYLNSYPDGPHTDDCAYLLTQV